MTIEDLKYFTRTRPVVCPIKPEDSGHWVIAKSVARLYINVHDPAIGPSRVRISDWLDRWTDSTRTTEYSAWGIVCW